jgi:transcriptional regulator with XRE-family HTH domain
MRSRVKARRATPADAEVGKRIRARRLELGLTQTQLGEKIGVTFQQLQKYEQGANRIGAGRLVRAAEALNLQVGDFFVGVSGDSDSQFLCKMEKDELRLLRAFDAIPNKHVRRLLVELSEEFLLLEESHG